MKTEVVPMTEARKSLTKAIMMMMMMMIYLPA